MDENCFIKKGTRIDKRGSTTWVCETCWLKQVCCSYITTKTFVLKDYTQRCPNFIGITEEGILCKMSQAIDFIMCD